MLKGHITAIRRSPIKTKRVLFMRETIDGGSIFRTGEGAFRNSPPPPRTPTTGGDIPHIIIKYK